VETALAVLTSPFNWTMRDIRTPIPPCALGARSAPKSASGAITLRERSPQELALLIEN